MRSPSSVVMCCLVSSCQGSCAQVARAEKAMILVSPPNLVQPSIPKVGRLKAATKAASPTSQPFLHILTHTCAYARARRDSFSLFLFSNPFKSRLARLGGWQSRMGIGFAPSNLAANLFLFEGRLVG